MDLFRQTFPSATIPPKMHMLEDHTMEWVRARSVGFGLLGEQGAESIHSRFNYLGRNFAPLAKGVERLRSIMKEHFSISTLRMLLLVPHQLRGES
jgi:hypothetical protein